MGKKIAIYGAGTIGACQATLTSGNGYSTVVIGHSEEGLSRCRNTMLQNWNNLIAQKLATAANRRAAMDLVTITNDVSALRDCDIVFEAVSEDVNIKQRVYSMRSIGITPVIEQTLGGSDITWLVENGLAAINIGVGMQEVHGCKEHILFEDMISTTEVLLRVLTT